MYKKSTKKGFILIEVLCSMMIFMLIGGVVLSVTKSYFNLKLYNHNLEKVISKGDYFIKKIKYNYSLDDIKKERQTNIFYGSNKKTYPYMIVNIDDNLNVYRINVKLAIFKHSHLEGEFLKSYEKE